VQAQARQPGDGAGTGADAVGHPAVAIGQITDLAPLADDRTLAEFLARPAGRPAHDAVASTVTGPDARVTAARVLAIAVASSIATAAANSVGSTKTAAISAISAFSTLATLAGNSAHGRRALTPTSVGQFRQVADRTATAGILAGIAVDGLVASDEILALEAAIATSAIGLAEVAPFALVAPCIASAAVATPAVDRTSATRALVRSRPVPAVQTALAADARGRGTSLSKVARRRLGRG
jgi:hypothetical protein